MYFGLKKGLVLAIGGCFALSLGIGVFIFFAYEKVDEEKVAMEGLDAQLIAARQKLAEIPDLEKRVVILRENVRHYMKILPNWNDIHNFIRKIYSFQDETGVQIDVIANTSDKQRGRPGKKKDDGFNKVSYQLQLTAGLWEFLGFLHHLESHERFIRAPKIKVRAGKRDKEQDPTTIKHNFNVEIETYVFNPKGNKKPVMIANYPRKVAELENEIIRARENILAEPYQYHGPRGRRDIFIDPRMQVEDGEGEAILTRQSNIVDQLRAEVARIGQMVKEYDRTKQMIKRFELRRDIEKSTSALMAEVERIEQEGLISYLPLVRRMQRDVVEAVVAMRSRFDPTAGDGGPSREELGEIARRMKQHLKDGDFLVAIDRYNLISERLALVEKDPSRAPIVGEIRKMFYQAKTAQEFGTKKMDIEGVIVSEEGSVALINGRAYGEGDYLEDELIVLKIHSDAIEFQYRDVVITKKI